MRALPLALRFALLSLLAGCAQGGSESSLREVPGPIDSAELVEPNQVRLDVLPSELLDRRGEFRVLPRTVGPIDIFEQGDAGTIQLHAPVELQGEVVGEFVTPIASGGTLPVVVGPVPASVAVRRTSSVQSYVATTDDDGIFGTLVVPQSDYEMVVVPDDPTVPFFVETVKVGQAPLFQELYIEYGVPVWGTVVDEAGLELPGVEVYAVDASGVRGASAFTDDRGRYLLYVLPDASYDIVAAGRVNGRDPSLTASLLVGEHGTPVDFVYRDLSPVFRGGTVLDTHGKPVEDVTVRFTSKSLDGYADEDARLTVEVVTGSGGNFDARLISGAYQVELVPPPADDPALDHSPLLVGDLVIEGSPDLGNLVLPPFVTVSGLVDSAEGLVPEARVSCREQGFGRREWSTYADADASWSLLLPQAPVTCTATPPGSLQLALAASRTPIDPASTPVVDLYMSAGVPITGFVRLDGAAEPYAVVEVRDLAGTLLGSTLTTDDGYFEIRVAP